MKKILFLMSFVSASIALAQQAPQFVFQPGEKVIYGSSTATVLQRLAPNSPQNQNNQVGYQIQFDSNGVINSGYSAAALYRTQDPVTGSTCMPLNEDAHALCVNATVQVNGTQWVGTVMGYTLTPSGPSYKVSFNGVAQYYNYQRDQISQLY